VELREEVVFADFREVNPAAKKMQLDLSKPDSAHIDEVNRYMNLKKTLDEEVQQLNDNESLWNNKFRATDGTRYGIDIKRIIVKG